MCQQGLNWNIPKTVHVTDRSSKYSVRAVNEKERKRRAPKARESKLRGGWGLGRGYKHIYQRQQSASQTHMQLILWT